MAGTANVYVRCGVNRSTVERCIDRAFEVGVVKGLDDRPRPGKEPTISSEARMWVLKYLGEVNENPVVFCWKKFEFENQMAAESTAA